MIQPILLTIALCSVTFFFVKEIRRLAQEVRAHYKDGGHD